MSIFKKIQFGIRFKVMAALTVIMLVLLLSGVIAFFEFGRMSKDMSKVISDNVLSVNVSRNMLNMCDQYHSILFQQINDDKIAASIVTQKPEMFETDLARLAGSVATDAERKMTDSVKYAYSAYMQVALELNSMEECTIDEKSEWYFGKLSVVYDKLRRYLQDLTEDSQLALTDNYEILNDSYYRSIMPSVVAMGAGIILVILFYYFLNNYFIKPLLKMTKGLRDYKDFRKKYNVTIESGGDQIREMNAMIKDLVEENTNLKKQRVNRV